MPKPQDKESVAKPKMQNKFLDQDLSQPGYFQPKAHAKIIFTLILNVIDDCLLQWSLTEWEITEN